MSEYTPDNWIIVELTSDDESIQKVIGGWSGGYLDGDSWRISSVVEKIEVDGDFVLITNYSGSLYKCHKSRQGTSIAMMPVLSQLEEASENDEEFSYKVIDWEEEDVS